MKKIEIVHDKLFFYILDELKKKKMIPGFTTVNVHSGYGARDGEYSLRLSLEEYYYTFIVYDESNVDSDVKEFIENLLQRAQKSILKLFVTETTVYTHDYA
jgi:nitrogen regulatory protein PII